MATQDLPAIPSLPGPDIGSVFLACPSATIVTAEDGRIEFLNEAAARLFRVDPFRAIGTDLRSLAPDLALALAPGGPDQDQIRIDGRGAHRVAAWKVERGGVGHRVVQLTLEGPASDDAAWLRILADHDPLTGLWNRGRLQQALRRISRRVIGEGWVVLLDLDRFGLINDTLGRRAGDAVLRQVALRCEHVLGHHDLARLDGDQFAVCLADVSEDEARIVAEALAGSISDSPIACGDGVETRVVATYGVGVIPRANDDLAASDAADDALDSAQRELTLWKPRRQSGSLSTSGAMTMVWAERLTHEMRAGRFELWSQPIVEVATARPVAHEVLIRARDHDDRLLPAGEFVPVAEDLGLTPLIDRWVLESGDLFVPLTWSAARVSVNISAQTLLRPDAEAEIAAWVGSTMLPPSAVTLEITESAPLDGERAAVVTRGLIERGFEISVDDFGTGWAAHQSLLTIACDEVKVAGTITALARTSPAARKTIEGIVRSAHAAGVRVVAEGVEDLDTFDVVACAGVDRVQGYLFGRPQMIAD